MSIRPYRDIHRRHCRRIHVGKVPVGSDAPITVQSMTNTVTSDVDATVAYLSTVRPFDRAGLAAALRGTDVVLVEPYLAGTSAAEVARALLDRPHRLLALGVEIPELRRYGTPAEHRAAQGLDATGIRASLTAFGTRQLRAAY